MDNTIDNEYQANGGHNPPDDDALEHHHHHPEGAEQGFTGNLELRSDEDVDSDETMSELEEEEEHDDDEFVDHAEEVLNKQRHHEDIIGGTHHHEVIDGIHHHTHHHYYSPHDLLSHHNGGDGLMGARKATKEAIYGKSKPSEHTITGQEGSNHSGHRSSNEDPVSPSMGFQGSLPDNEDLSPRPSNRILSKTFSNDSHHDTSRDHSPDMLGHNKSKHKTFSFGMPFSNPLANKETTKKRASTFSNPFKHHDKDGSSGPFDNELGIVDSAIQAQHETVSEIRQKLNRNLSITTEEEDKLFGNKHELQSVRVNKIVSNATMPTVIDSMKIGNKQKLAKHDPFNALEGDFVILGGYRGSVLRDAKSKRRVWIPIKVGFNLRKIDLTVNTDDEAEINMEKKIYPDGMLTHIGPIDLSKRLIQKISYNPKCRIRDFGYDWRLDCGLNAHKLIEFLEIIHKENGGKKVTVMAHSMGGLVTHKAMLLRPDLFKGVLYLGSPSECPSILGPVKNGDAVLLSSKVLTAQVNFLMRSSFIFLPENKQLFIDKNTGQRIDIDFYDPEEWKKHALCPCVSEEHRLRCLELKKRDRIVSGDKLEQNPGVKPHREDEEKEKEKHHLKFKPGATVHKLFDSVVKHNKDVPITHYQNLHPDTVTAESNAVGHSGQMSMNSSNNDANIPTIDYDDACAYLERTLKRTKELRASFWYDEKRKDEYPPLACVIGTTVPTLKACRVDGLDGIYRGDYSDFVLGSGDGVVYSKWNMPEPFGFKVVAKVKTNRGHVGLMTDHVAVGKALIALQDAAEKRAKGEPYLPDVTPVHSISVTEGGSGASTPSHSAPSSAQGSPAPPHHRAQFSSPLKQ